MATATVKRLNGRTALVAGGTKGIGNAIVHRLAAEGADVLIIGRGCTVFEVAEEIRMTTEVRAMGCIADCTKPDDVRRLFEDGSGLFGSRLDILVNNIGGVEEFAIFDQIEEDAWYRVFENNVMTTVRLTKAALPFLLKSPHASIINIASVAGVQAGFYNCHYGSMKAAIIHLTKYLAANYGAKNVRANSISMSTVKGGVWERDVKNKARMDGITFSEAETRLEADVKAKAVIKEIVMPEDVAATAAFLASDDARMITGSNVNVDCGTVRKI